MMEIPKKCFLRGPSIWWSNLFETAMSCAPARDAQVRSIPMAAGLAVDAALQALAQAPRWAGPCPASCPLHLPAMPARLCAGRQRPCPAPASQTAGPVQTPVPQRTLPPEEVGDALEAHQRYQAAIAAYRRRSILRRRLEQDGHRLPDDVQPEGRLALLPGFAQARSEECPRPQ